MEFATLLDLTKSVLLGTLLPHPTKITLGLFNRKMQFEAELAKKTKRINGAKRLIDVADELYSLGREEKKVRSWCE